MYKSTSSIKITIILFFLVLLFFLDTISSISAQQKEPEKGIKITLSVYSGRPDPQWWIKSGSDYERLIRLIKKLEVKKENLFKYEEWNRLGYASFWINPKNVEELPYAIHVWRDMAYV